MKKIRKDCDYIVLFEQEYQHQTIRVVNLYKGKDSLPPHHNSNFMRVSPCFMVTGDGLVEEIADEMLKGKGWLIFAGPSPLSSIEGELTEGDAVWLTYGSYNLMWITRQESRMTAMSQFLKEKRIRFEQWTIDDGIVTETYHEAWEQGAPFNCSYTLYDLTERGNNDMLFTAIREYYNLMGVAFQRLRYIDGTAYERLKRFHEMVEIEMCSHKKSDGDSMFFYLTSVNACLTRYNQQMVSSYSPIFGHETNTGSHSLLGLGLASLGINNLGNDVAARIVRQQILERFSCIMDKDYDAKFPPMPMVRSNENVFGMFHLDDTPAVGNVTPMPVLLYFSSRDGFRRQNGAVSIPLVALYGCAKPGWSLKTVSHEMSHILIANVLGMILPRESDNDLKKAFCNACDHTKKTATYREAVWQLFGNGMLALGVEDNKVAATQLSVETLDEFIHAFEDDMDEIMTHAFDFLYFYRNNIDNYITDVWTTWSELPGISDEWVNEYIVRSLCIVALHHLGDDSCDLVEILLDKLITLEKERAFRYPYIHKAVNVLQGLKRHPILRRETMIRVANRQFLTKFVHAFLFSERISEQVNTGWAPDISPLNSEDSLPIPDCKLGNLLESVGRLSKNRPEEVGCAESYLVYYQLAFCNNVANN